MIVTIDTTGMSYINGLIDGMGQGINRSNFLSNAINLAHSTLNAEFEEWMDIAALANPSNLMHVYEWGQLGRPDGRLWESVLMGGPTKTKKSMVVWKPSTVPTPVRPELLTPGPTGKTVKEGVHVFVWKAPVMEAGLQITVAPQGDGPLAYIDANGALRITKKPSTFEAGGGKTAGQFTSRYFTWWNTMAQGMYQSKVAPKFQANVAAGAARGAKKAGHRTLFRIAASDQANFSLGVNEGLKAASQIGRNFALEAAARKAYLYGS